MLELQKKSRRENNNTKSCDYSMLDNSKDNIQKKKRLTYQNLGSNKDLLDNREMKISFAYDNQNFEFKENFTNSNKSNKEEIEINSDFAKNNFSFYKSKGTALDEEKKQEINTDDNNNINFKIKAKIEYDNNNISKQLESNNNSYCNGGFINPLFSSPL